MHYVGRHTHPDAPDNQLVAFGQRLCLVALDAVSVVYALTVLLGAALGAWWAWLTFASLW